jgi:hypothetical protein
LTLFLNSIVRSIKRLPCSDSGSAFEAAAKMRAFDPKPPKEITKIIQRSNRTDKENLKFVGAVRLVEADKVCSCGLEAPSN